jgi:hypothetical protein
MDLLAATDGIPVVSDGYRGPFSNPIFRQPETALSRAAAITLPVNDLSTLFPKPGDVRRKAHCCHTFLDITLDNNDSSSSTVFYSYRFLR